MSRIVFFAVLFALLASAPRTAAANCEPAHQVHGGAAFLASFTGTWQLSGQVEGRSVVGTAVGTVADQALTLTFRLADGAQIGISRLWLRYDERCDDYIAVRDEWGADGKLRRTSGRGIEREGAIDVVFSNDAGKSDASFTPDAHARAWTMSLARLHDANAWQSYARMRLTRE